jgi:hypothetical protein
VSKHFKAHLDIEKATGEAIAENTKIRKLLASIDCSVMVTAVAGFKLKTISTTALTSRSTVCERLS